MKPKLVGFLFALRAAKTVGHLFLAIVLPYCDDRNQTNTFFVWLSPQHQSQNGNRSKLNMALRRSSQGLSGMRSENRASLHLQTHQRLSYNGSLKCIFWFRAKSILRRLWLSISNVQIDSQPERLTQKCFRTGDCKKSEAISMETQRASQHWIGSELENEHGSVLLSCVIELSLSISSAIFLRVPLNLLRVHTSNDTPDLRT